MTQHTDRLFPLHTASIEEGATVAALPWLCLLALPRRNVAEASAPRRLVLLAFASWLLGRLCETWPYHTSLTDPFWVATLAVPFV